MHNYIQFLFSYFSTVVMVATSLTIAQTLRVNQDNLNAQIKNALIQFCCAMVLMTVKISQMKRTVMTMFALTRSSNVVKRITAPRIALTLLKG